MLNDGDEWEFNSDSEYDMEEDGDDDPYYQYDESYYPFPSKIFALLYILVSSPHPLVSLYVVLWQGEKNLLTFWQIGKLYVYIVLRQGEKNLLLIWYILGQIGIRVPSLASIKSFKLPDMKPPVQVSVHVYLVLVIDL